MPPRRALASLVLLASVVGASPALAEGVCDPDGHFCVQLDTTSASVCDLLRPGGLDPDQCSVVDAQRREALRKASLRTVRALMIRFDDFWVDAVVTKEPPLGERTQAEVEARAKEARERLSREANVDVSVDGTSVQRVRDVQVVRYLTRAPSEAGLAVVVDDVYAADATYHVMLRGPEGARLGAFADAVTASIDAVPGRRAGGAGEAVTWLVRGLLVAVVLAAAGIALGRRKGRRGIAAGDLWPR